MNENSVVIVGAGPVGLALASELGWRNVPVTVFDQGDGSVPFPAGEAVFSRTMEHLRRWGISNRTREESLPPPDYPHRVVFMTQVVGHLLAEFDSGVTNRNPGSYRDISPEGPTFFSKFSFLPALRKAAEAFPGVHIRYGHEVVAVSQDESGVTATVLDHSTDQQHQVRTDYLVSCEGGKSRIRHALGIPLEGMFAQGKNFAVHFRAPALMDLLRRYAHGPVVQIQTLATGQRPYITVVNGSDEWRLSAYLEHEPAAGEAAALVRDAVGADIDVQILTAQQWSGHRVVARSYRDGRIFLAGDAAHLLWPKGGFGANTGIGDAVDLGWKLAAVLHGWGGPGLLESYEIERRPIAQRNVDEAARNWTADLGLVPDPVLQADGAAGDQARQAAAAEIGRLRAREYRVAGVQLGYRYAESPICVPDGTPEPPDQPDLYIPTTWPGARAPHAWLADGTSTLDHFGRGFTIVATRGLDVGALLTAAEDAGVPLNTLWIEDAEVTRLYQAHLVLVRPDGHVCWRGNHLPADVEALLDRVRGGQSRM